MIDPFRNAANTLNEAAPPGERLAFVNPLEEAGLMAAGGQGKPAAGEFPATKRETWKPRPLAIWARKWATLCPRR